MAHKLWTVIEQLKESQQPTTKKSEFDLEGRDACASIERLVFNFYAGRYYRKFIKWRGFGVGGGFGEGKGVIKRVFIWKYILGNPIYLHYSAISEIRFSFNPMKYELLEPTYQKRLSSICTSGLLHV